MNRVEMENVFAMELRNVFDQGTDIHLYFFEDKAGVVLDIDNTILNNDTMSTSNEVMMNRSLKEVIIDSSSMPTLSTFEALLTCIDQIDELYLQDQAVSLIDEFETRSMKESECIRRVPRVCCIELWGISHSWPSVNFVKFVARVNSTKLGIHLSSNLPFSAESFSELCKALTDDENVRETMRELEIFDFRNEEFFHETMIESLVYLLNSMHKLRLKLGDGLRKKISLFPTSLHDRISTSIN